MTPFSNILIILLPLLSITIIGKFFPANNQPYHPVFQPPNWVFPVIWTYITITFGLVTYDALNKTSQKDIVLLLYSMILICLNGWLIINSNKNYKRAFYILVSTSVLTTIYLIFISQWTHSVYALIPMCIWLVLASALNGVIYDRSINII